MADDRPGRGSDQFALRMPDGMRERIKEAAAENGRSMNAEIVAALEALYPPPNLEEELQAELMFLLIHSQNEQELNKEYIKYKNAVERNLLKKEAAKTVQSIYNIKREQLGLSPLNLPTTETE